MKRRYKLLLIIVIGSVLTYFISFSTKKSKINLVALGDGISLGMTPYNVIGYSFNDYLKEYLEESNNLNNYNKDFCISHLTINQLKNILANNIIGQNSRLPIKQVIAQADILTIAIGEDEFADLSLKTKIKEDDIDNFIKTYENFINEIRMFYDKKIVIVSLYPAYKMSKNNTIEINDKLSKLAVKYKLKYIDILPISLNSNYYLQQTSYYMNYKAHKKISENIIRFEIL